VKAGLFGIGAELERPRASALVLLIAACRISGDRAELRITARQMSVPVLAAVADRDRGRAGNGAVDQQGAAGAHRPCSPSSQVGCDGVDTAGVQRRKPPLPTVST